MSDLPANTGTFLIGVTAVFGLFTLLAVVWGLESGWKLVMPLLKTAAFFFIIFLAATLTYFSGR